MHQKRIRAINDAEQKNRGYFRRIRVRDYLPGQVIYHLGDYPGRISPRPTEYDVRVLTELAANGVELVQLHEEWNDVNRLYGGTKHTAADEEGMKAFVDLCHSLGLKVISYISSGFFSEDDPDFSEDFVNHYDLSKVYNPKRLRIRQLHMNYRKCSPGSAAWREYLLPRTFAALDTYGFDGIYNDWGYDKVAFAPAMGAELPYDPEIEDLLGIIYNEVKRRGGIYKLHADRNNKPNVKDRVYDYLWIGEAVELDKVSAGSGKDFDPYVVPCMDMVNSKNGLDQDGYMARTVPFLQFPILKYGRPVLGNNLNLPGVTYYGQVEQEFFERVAEYMKSHPNGPYAYSSWSAIPDDPNDYPNWLKYLKLYRPMVTENSLAYIELSESAYVKSPLGGNMVATMFVNEETYLTVSNFDDAPYELVLDGTWRDRETGERGSTFTVRKNKMRFLIKE